MSILLEWLGLFRVLSEDTVFASRPFLCYSSHTSFNGIEFIFPFPGMQKSLFYRKICRPLQDRIDLRRICIDFFNVTRPSWADNIVQFHTGNVLKFFY